MKFLYLTAAIASLLSALIAFFNGDLGYALGLLGSSGAWIMVTTSEWIFQQ